MLSKRFFICGPIKIWGNSSTSLLHLLKHKHIGQFFISAIRRETQFSARLNITYCIKANEQHLHYHQSYAYLCFIGLHLQVYSTKISFQATFLHSNQRQSHGDLWPNFPVCRPKLIFLSFRTFVLVFLRMHLTVCVPGHPRF